MQLDVLVITKLSSVMGCEGINHTRFQDIDLLSPGGSKKNHGTIK
jgi:hypothetical protein